MYSCGSFTETKPILDQNVSVLDLVGLLIFTFLVLLQTKEVKTLVLFNFCHVFYVFFLFS